MGHSRLNIFFSIFQILLEAPIVQIEIKKHKKAHLHDTKDQIWLFFLNYKFMTGLLIYTGEKITYS